VTKNVKTKQIRLKAPTDQTTTGIYGVDADGKTIEYPDGHILTVSEDFDHKAIWPGRSELVGGENEVKSDELTADNAAQEEIERLRAERERLITDADAAIDEAKKKAEVAIQSADAERTKAMAEASDAKKKADAAETALAEAKKKADAEAERFKKLEAELAEAKKSKAP
jgi:hypothetical protein